MAEISEKIYCNYFDRNSDKLVVIGSPFADHKENMVSFLRIFDCDILLFDHRGHHYFETNLYNPLSWKLDPRKILFPLNGKKITMGRLEHLDTITVTETFKKRKSYKQVFGFGTCYSGVTAIKAQSVYKQETGKNLFDKIIVDGAWSSLQNELGYQINSVIDGNNPRVKFCPIGLKWSRKVPILITMATKIFEMISGIPMRKLKLNTLEYLKTIDIPILFIHGRQDTQVPIEDFYKTWNATNKTSQKSRYNHAKQTCK